MAPFRSTCIGHRGEASRLGTKSSGMRTTCNGWDIGTQITAVHNTELQTDVMHIELNCGSNSSRTLGRLSFAIVDNKLRILQTDFPELLI